MPSIAQQLANRAESIDKRAARGDFAKLCLMLCKHGDAFTARAHAEAERASVRVQNILKSAVTGGGIDTWGSIADYQNIQTAFQESLRSQSVFDTVLDSMVRAPLRSRGFSITTGITGGVVPERSVKPISSLVLAQQLLEPKKASAIIVISKELANFPGASQLFGNELTKGVVAATDSTFLAALVAGAASTIPSAGATLAQIATDMEVLLTNVTTSATSQLFYVASPANIKSLVAKYAAVGPSGFPELGPTGGELWPGVTAIASDQIAATAAILFDAQAIVGNSDAIVPDRSDMTSLQMETSPDSPPVAGTAMQSLWQLDEVALRMERWFGFVITRATGIAALSGVNY